MPKRKCTDGRRNNKPPVEHQFKPGVCPYKGGPRKKKMKLIDIFAAELNSKYLVGSGENSTKISLAELLIKQIIRQAMKGKSKELFYAMEMIGAVHEYEALVETQRRPTVTKEEFRALSEDEKNRICREALHEVTEARDRYEKTGK